MVIIFSVHLNSPESYSPPYLYIPKQYYDGYFSNVYKILPQQGADKWAGSEWKSNALSLLLG